MAPDDYFLKIDGIDGESTDARHPNEIVVRSWAFGAASTGNAFGAGGGGGAGKVTFQNLQCTKTFDKSSIPLFVACCSGQHLKSATLVCRKAGQQPFEFLTIAMSDVVVSSDSLFGSIDGVQDQIALAFARIVFSYTTQGPNGQPLPTVTGGWDIVANRKL